MLGFLHGMPKNYLKFCIVTRFNKEVDNDKLTNAITMGIIAEILT